MTYWLGAELLCGICWYDLLKGFCTQVVVGVSSYRSRG